MSIRPLPKLLQEKAILELNEVPSRIQEDIDHIREWLSKQPHIKARTDDQWVLSFLRGCKFSLQRTKEKLEMYYVMRSLSPDLFTNRDASLPEMQAFLKQRLWTVSPRDKDLLSPTRVVMRAKNANPETANATIAFLTFFMVWEILMYEDDCFVINGQEVIVDLEGMHYSYVAQLTPTFLKKLVNILFHSYVSRLKSIYFINVPTIFHAVLNIFIPLLPEKIKSRVHIFSEKSMESLHKFIPQSVLPDEYGGHAGKFDELSEKCEIMLKDHHDWFLEDSKYGYDKKKRQEMSKWMLEYASDMEGSFRKLDVD